MNATKSQKKAQALLETVQVEVEDRLSKLRQKSRILIMSLEMKFESMLASSASTDELDMSVEEFCKLKSGNSKEIFKNLSTNSEVKHSGKPGNNRFHPYARPSNQSSVKQPGAINTPMGKRGLSSAIKMLSHKQRSVSGSSQAPRSSNVLALPLAASSKNTPSAKSSKNEQKSQQFLLSLDDDPGAADMSIHQFNQLDGESKRQVEQSLVELQQKLQFYLDYVHKQQ